MAGSLTSLIWLTLGAFAIGTEGFMIAGLLPALAHDLDVSLPAAGHPRQPPRAVASLGERLVLAKRADVLSVLAVSVLTVAGTFTVYTYLSAFMQAVTGLGPRGLAVVLLAYGAASAVGTRVGGAAADHWGARCTVVFGCGPVLLAYLALALGAVLEQAAMPILLTAILLWGLAGWAVMTAQQARLVALAPDLAPVSLSLNSSAIYLGSAIGSAVGAVMIADGAVRMLGYVASCISLAALLTVLVRPTCNGKGSFSL